ncbi:MAG: hypothetical protein AAFU86_16165 [Pseudomonadota bacterium]
MIDNDYLATLPKNKLLAANKICTDFLADNLRDDPVDVAFTLKVLLEGIVDLDKENSTEVSANFVFFRIDKFKLRRAAAHEEVIQYHRYIKALITRETIENPAIINTFLISLSAEEKSKIDDLLSEIRNIIRESTAITDEFKRRLLKTVNSLQSELDKEYSDYRVFLDGMVEVSEAVGEAGENVKPVFDRFKELFGIADKVRKAKEALEAPTSPEALPPPAKELPSPDEFDSE